PVPVHQPVPERQSVPEREPVPVTVLHSVSTFLSFRARGLSGGRESTSKILDFTSPVHYHACLVPPRCPKGVRISKFKGPDPFWGADLPRETAWALHPPSVAAASHG